MPLAMARPAITSLGTTQPGRSQVKDGVADGLHVQVGLVRVPFGRQKMRWKTQREQLKIS